MNGLVLQHTRTDGGVRFSAGSLQLGSKSRTAQLRAYRAFATSATMHDHDFAFVRAMAYYVLEVKHAHLERQRQNVQRSLRHVGRARHLSTIMEHIDPDTEYIT